MMEWRQFFNLSPLPGPGALLNVEALTPGARAALYALLCRLVMADLDRASRLQLEAILGALQARQPGQSLMLCQGRFTDFPAPVEAIKLLPVNPKRK